MALQVSGWKQVTGNGASGPNHSITGVGFQPIAVLAMRVGSVTNEDTFNSGGDFCFGMATRRGGSTQQRLQITTFSDNAGTSAASSRWATGLCQFNTSGVMTLTSLDSDGFTVTYAGNETSEWLYFAIGGSDVTDACVVEDDWPTSGATFDVIGAGFTPDCGIFMTGLQTGNADNVPVTTRSDFGFGVFAGSAQWSISISETSGDTMASTMNNNSVFSADACITLLGNNADTVDAKGIFSAFTSDGATITNTNAPTTALRIFALYLKGGQYKAGSKAKSSGSGADSFTFNTPSFLPTGVLLAQAVGTASNTVIAGTAELTIGGASTTDGSIEGYAGRTEIEAINTTSDQIKSNTKSLAEFIPGTSPTIDAAADMTAFANGSFELTWDATGTAALVGFLAMGSDPTKAPPPQTLRYQRQRQRISRRLAA